MFLALKSTECQAWDGEAGPGRSAYPGAVTGRRGTATALLSYLLAAFLLFSGTWLHPAGRIVGRCCDAVTSVSWLRWTGFAVLGGHDPFLSGSLNAPHGVNVLWQPQASPLLGLLLTPVEHLAGPLVTYNLLATLAPALAAFTAFLAIRRWVGGTLGPLLGGTLFGFSPFVTSQSLGHLHVTFLALLPLILIVEVDAVTDRRIRPTRAGLLLGALCGAQLLIGEEMLVQVVLAGALVALVLAVVLRAQLRDRLGGLARVALVAAATFAVLAGIPLAVQLAGPLRPPSPFVVFPPWPADLAGFLFPTYSMAAYSVPSLRDVSAGWFPNPIDQGNAYIGAPLLLLVLVAAWTGRRTRAVRVAAPVALALAVASLGSSLVVAGHHTGIPLPGALLARIPLLQDVIPGRLPALEWLGLAVIVAVGVRRLGALPAGRRRVGLVLVAAAVATVCPQLPYPSYPVTTPAFFESPAGVGRLPAGTTVYLAPFPRGQAPNVETMVWQAESGFRFAMPGGYVLVPGPGNRTASPFRPVDPLSSLVMAGGTPEPGPADRPALLVDLRRTGATAVVVGPMSGQAAVIRLFTDLLGRPPRWEGGVALWTGLTR